MTGNRETGTRIDVHDVSTPVDPFMDAKLHWPPPRQHGLPRPRLVERLRAVSEHPVTLIAAPAGYGKTTLVAQWLEEAHPEAAWVSLDPGDNDVNRLWAHITAALARAGCRLDTIGRGTRVEGGDTTAPGSVLTAIVEALGRMRHDVVLVLDDFQFLRSEQCHAQVELLIGHLPPQAHLVVLSRSDPGLRLGRLRESGDLLEIRAHDLAFEEDDAQALLRRHDVVLEADTLHLLMDSTEGWPAGLYLASLSLAGRSAPDVFVRSLIEGNRYIGDYLTEEVLSRHPDDVRDFVVATSVLDRFSAPLCDHVRAASGSAAILRELERTNLFLMPLDDSAHWYRFHHLFAAVARSELDVSSRHDIRTLHARAAAWFDQEGHVDEAVTHLIAAGDAAGAATLVQRHWLQFVDAGRISTVLGWSQRIRVPDGATDPAASVTSAWLAALIGDESSLASHLSVLDHHRDLGPLPDGARSVESATMMIKSLFGYGGPRQMLQAGQRAAELEVDRHSPFYALAQVALGHAHYVAGALDEALPSLSNARHNDRSPRVIRALGLATESLVEHERGNLELCCTHAEDAMGILEGNGLSAMPQASLAYTALGQATAATGRVEEALDTLAQGLELRRETSAHGPWGMIHHLVVHAGVAVEGGQTALAVDLLDELESRTARFADGMEAIHARTEAVRRCLRARGLPTARLEELTARESEVLRMLQGTLSLQEIAVELYLSFNTVKTHSRAVYRKLGAHTRAEAVVVARRQGLI